MLIVNEICYQSSDEFKMAGDGKRNFPLELEIGAKTDLIEFFKLKCEKIAILFWKTKRIS